MAAVTKNCRFLGNNSKTVNNIRNLNWGKNDQHSQDIPALQF
jgi:hypothetical protein